MDSLGLLERRLGLQPHSARTGVWPEKWGFPDQPQHLACGEPEDMAGATVPIPAAVALWVCP